MPRKVFTTQYERELTRSYKNGITIDDVLANDGLNKQILSQIKKEVDQGKKYMSQKRALRQEREGKYRNPAVGNRDWVKVNMLHQHLKSHISTHVGNVYTPAFIGAEFLDDERAYKLEKVMQNDFREMKKGAKDFQYFHDIGFYGVGIRYITAYDKEGHRSQYTNVDPNCWIPDVRWDMFNGWRYNYFSVISNINTLIEANHEAKREIYVNLDKINKGRSSEQESLQSSRDQNALVDTSEGREETINLIHGETIIGGYKYAVTLDANITTIIRLELLKPRTKAEKRNPLLVPWNFQVCNVFPLRGDPAGMGYAELILDFQNAKNRLLNLALIQEEDEAGYGQFIADINKIVNIDLLAERNTHWPTFIPARGNAQGIAWAIEKISKGGASGNTINLADKLDNEAQNQTGQTLMNRWLQTSPNMTLGQSKQMQINSNVIFSLDSFMIMEGEKEFISICLRYLTVNINPTTKKRGRIGNGLASQGIEMTGKEIKQVANPDIIIYSKKEQDEQNRERYNYMIQREATIMQDPNIPTISKLFFSREMYTLAGQPREKVYREYPLTTDERDALDLMYLINNDLIPEHPFRENADLFTYFIYLQACKNNKAKQTILRELENLISQQELIKEISLGNQEQMRGLMNQTQAQVTGNMISNANNNVISREM